MIENLQDELYQLENKQTNGAKFRANSRRELESQKCSKTFFKVLERQNRQNQTTSKYLNQTISKLYADDDKSKYPSNPKDIKSTKRNS